LKALDVQYVIVGHSERRQYHHETDETVAEKAALAIRYGMVPVICVGETAEDLDLYGPSAVPVQQLHGALAASAGATDIVVAYEPVWAIGSGQAATPEQAEQVAEQLRQVVAKLLGSEVADATRILYGGSVKSTNVASFLRQPNVDGALVGGASLDIAEFASIAQFRKHVGT
jgi:triosephosphate isomerase (TIM)